MELGGGSTNTSTVVLTGSNATTSTANTTFSTTLNTYGLGNVSLVGTSSSGAGVYFSGGNVTLNANGNSLDITGVSATGVGVQFAGVTRNIVTNSSSLNSASGVSTISNTSQLTNPNLQLTLAGNVSSIIGNASSGIGSYLGNITLNGTAFNVSGYSQTGVGLQVGGIATTLSSLGLNTSSNISAGSVLTNVTTATSLIADPNGVAILNPAGITLNGTSNASTGILLTANSNVSVSFGNLTLVSGAGDIAQSQGSMVNVSGDLRLLAGVNYSAGTSAGGNVSLSSSGVTVNNGSTVTVFSGQAINTSSMVANISGASGAIDYKTYNASLGSIASVSGTKNIYYRNAPNVSVLVANKIYDATNNASAQLTGGAIDGDTLALAGTFFYANASAGLQSINTSLASVTSTNSSWIVSGYGFNTTTATISKANVSITGATVNNKVYDTTTNASIASNGSATVILGNASLANGSVNSSVAYTNYTGITGNFTNASAGTQTANLTAVIGDTTNYTIASIDGTSATNGLAQAATTATISKANVVLNVSGAASNKVYDTTTNALVTGNSSGVVQLGDSSYAGGVAGNTTFAASLVNTGGTFTNASAGSQTVNLANTLKDATNYTIVSDSALTTSATISKANVSITGATVNNKVYDTTTNASIASNGSATVILGNASLANGSVNSSVAYTNYTGITGNFTNASAGTQTANLTAVIGDTTNYTIASIDGTSATNGLAQAATTATISKANNGDQLNTSYQASIDNLYQLQILGKDQFIQPQNSALPKYSIDQVKIDNFSDKSIFIALPIIFLDLPTKIPLDNNE